MLLDIDAIRGADQVSNRDVARALDDRDVRTPSGGGVWTHTTVGRLLARAGMERFATLGDAGILRQSAATISGSAGIGRRPDEIMERWTGRPPWGYRAPK